MRADCTYFDAIHFHSRRHRRLDVRMKNVRGKAKGRRKVCEFQVFFSLFISFRFGIAIAFERVLND